jgi:hypothetical protein
VRTNYCVLLLILYTTLANPAFAGDPCSHSYIEGAHHVIVYNYLGQPTGTPRAIVALVDNQTAPINDSPGGCSFVTDVGTHVIRIEVVPNEYETKSPRTEMATVTLDTGAHWNASCELSNSPGVSCDYLPQ